MAVLIAAVAGAILGSFLNALSFRWGTGRSVLKGRSRCMRCGETLRVADLVPIFSYFFLRGRCRYCHTSVSLQYPLVEITAALVAVMVYVTHPDPTAFLYWLVFWMILLFIFVYDARHKIIPPSASLVVGALALGSIYLFGEGTLYDFLAGPILALPLVLMSLVSRERWMGWGDSLLELGLGWMLGLSAGFTAFVLAFWVGAIAGIPYLLFKYGGWRVTGLRLTMNGEIPFAPFLILGAAVAYFFHVDFFTHFSALWY